MRAAFMSFAVVLVLLGVAMYFFYPVYPSPKPLCDLYVDPKPSHVGAVVVVSGRVYGGYGNSYFMAASCTGGIMYLGLNVTMVTAMSPMSRHALNQLTMEKSVRATVVARVDSQGWGCFGPGTVLSAMAVSVSGPVEPIGVSGGSAAVP